MNILDTIRGELLGEAARSPGMLADLAGLERYISESYSARAFIELLQNADDAGARTVLFAQVGDSLICANDGSEFTLQDFRSLCRSASSKKNRGISIGYRGVGFKSVVNIASEVHLYSGGLEGTFSRTRTQLAVGADVPVPLLRIPHHLANGDTGSHDFVHELRGQGMNTAFVMQGLDMTQVSEEFERFETDYLIFLRSVEKVKLSYSVDEEFGCDRSRKTDQFFRLVTFSDSRREEWELRSFRGVTLAFAVEDDLPVPLRLDQSVVHAFLPMLEQSGFPVRINGDFSTDPSRTRIVLDDKTASLVSDAADIIGKLVRANITGGSDTANRLLDCLVPNVDESVLSMQRRSFRSDLIAAVRSRLSPMRKFVSLAPSWLNENDSQLINLDNLNRMVVPQNSSVLGSSSKLASLAGVPTLGADEIMKCAVAGSISQNGTAELIAFVANSVVPSRVSLSDIAESKLWYSEAGQRGSLAELAEDDDTLSVGFQTLLQSNGVDFSVLNRRLERLGGSLVKITDVGENRKDLVGGREPGVSARNSESGKSSGGLSDPLAVVGKGSAGRIPTARNSSVWRSAELSVLGLLKDLGYSALDNSRQNLGYDIVAKHGATSYFVEVKSISYPGQPFALTPNEDSFARDFDGFYIIALVYRSKESTNIQFIRNPRASLQFVKQCRQWAWECSEYDFVPDYELIQ